MLSSVYITEPSCVQDTSSAEAPRELVQGLADLSLSNEVAEAVQPAQADSAELAGLEALEASLGVQVGRL